MLIFLQILIVIVPLLGLTYIAFRKEGEGRPI